MFIRAQISGPQVEELIPSICIPVTTRVLWFLYRNPVWCIYFPKTSGLLGLPKVDPLKTPISRILPGFGVLCQVPRLQVPTSTPRLLLRLQEAWVSLPRPAGTVPASTTQCGASMQRTGVTTPTTLKEVQKRKLAHVPALC